MISWIKLCPLFVFCTAYTHGAALDKSGQSITAFLEQGNYAEFSLGHIEGDISGEIPKRKELVAAGITDFSTANLMPNLTVAQGAVKLQLHPHISVVLLYDQPFGAEVGYNIHHPKQSHSLPLESTYFNFQSESLRFLLGFQPNKHWNFFTGLNYQSIESSLKLQGERFSIFSGYQAHIKTDESIGGILGISYQIPAYALKSTLSYHSKIRYEPIIEESIEGKNLEYSPSQPSLIETPQSINFDFQTGIISKTLLYGSIRWVDWSKFSIQPTQFDNITQAIFQSLQTQESINLIDYKDDQWSATLGLARQLSNKWAMSVEYGWDSGTGNPASSFAPIDSLYHAGINARYKLNSKTSFTVGMKYIWFNPADVTDSSTIDLTQQITSLSQAKRNTALAYGFKIARSF